MGTAASPPPLQPSPAASEWRPNLSWLTDKLAIGGSFPAERAGELACALGIRAVVDLRDECCDDPVLMERAGLAFVHLPAPDHHPLPLEMIDRGVALADRHLAAGERVLLHCEHGIGRSALLALCVLVDQGMEPLEALTLAKARRPVFSPSPAQYHAWADWLARRGRAAPDFQTFAGIAYAHLAPT